MLKDYVEKVDRDFIGVDIHIGRVDLCLCYGRVLIHNLQVDNPKGYKSRYLLQSKEVVIDVDMLELMLTKGKHLVVEELKLEGIDAIIEYDSVIAGSFFGTSNLQTILNFMDNKDQDEQAAEAEKAEKEEEEDEVDQNKKKEKRKYTVQLVQFLDVGAKMAGKFGGMRIACADTRFKHFSEQFGVHSVGQVIALLVKSMLKSIISNVAGKEAGNKVL
eukprot:gnl/TRDRNA2_/TRDRNA2_162893_c0_seq1.p1 gnl/TRDRNA2_/TRDRNA2_162893_c0~~gnl/TRDRNA2_/TRDRNA2_162893_c0_seq1.p1  ORF type:complete len:217 (-),score=51.35 gnl/TRDRNA2_/TRDRNA2_162893_c0_seq1:227-877(-)